MKKLLLLLILFPIISGNCFADFSDVDENTTYYDSILYAQDKGIVQGYDDGLFRPYNSITRSEFTKVIIESTFSDEEIASCDLSTVDFYDVSFDDWALKYICVAKENDIIRGYSNGLFRPSQLINFAEAAKIITVSFKIQIERFPEDLYWYYPYLNALVERKAIPTTIDSVFDEVNRAEMVRMMYLLGENVQSDEYKLLMHASLWDYKSDLLDLGWGFVKFDGKIWGNPSFDLSQVDVDSFVALSEVDAKDKNHAYKFNQDYNIIDQADVETYEALNNVYSKDKNNVYFEGKIIEGNIDPETFELVEMVYTEMDLAYNYPEWEKNLTMNYHAPILSYGKDKNNVYFMSNIVEGADLNSFVAYAFVQYLEDLYPPYAKDSNNVYFNGNILSNDAANFELFSWLYSKDTDFVYFTNKKVDGADPDTFVSTNDWDEGKDKNCEYLEENSMLCI